MSAEDRLHHPFSPSTLNSREACPKYQPTQTESDASRMGTLQHNAVESDEDDARLSDRRALVVAQCKELITDRIAEFGMGARTFREVYLPVDDEKIKAPDGTVWEGSTGGYLDFGIVSADETHAEVLDWKFGRNAVTHAQENLQGISYMLGLKRKFPKLRTCRVLFFQPHIDHESEHTFDITDPSALLLRVRTVVARAQEASKNPADYSMARASLGACNFCALVGLCPKVAEFAIQIGKKYAPLALPDDINTVTLEDPAQVSIGIKLAQIVKLWAESFRRNATQKAIHDEDFIPDGYVLVPSAKIKLLHPRKVGDIAKRFVPAEQSEKVDALFDVKITHLDELVELMAPRGKKTETSEAFRKALIEEGAAEMGQSYSTLRMATDKDIGKIASR